MTTPMKENATAWPASGPAPNQARVDGAADDRIRLILVDDDDDFREAASGELTDLGFAVQSFADGQSMLSSVADGTTADVIVLDWGLPSISGIDLLPRLRREGIQLPVVFLTGRSSPHHEHLAFDRGALDFVDKARGVAILAKRIRVIVEFVQAPAGARGRGDPALRPPDAEAAGQSRLLGRSGRQPDAHRVQHRAPAGFNVGSHVTYRAVYDCMHHVGFIAGSGENGYRTNVRSSIKRIRNKFQLVDPEFAEIENYPSFGYRWGKPKDAAA